MPQGKPLKRQSKKMVFDVYTFMAKEAKEGVTNLKAVQKRTAFATNISLVTVKRIVKEANTLSEIRAPGRKKNRSKPITNVDDFDKGVIKRCIHNFHISNQELPSVRKIQQKLSDDIGFQGSASSLRRIIKDLGFRWRKTESNKKILVEKSYIRLKRIDYLKKLKRYRQEGRPIIYTDESCMHPAHTSTPKPWTDPSRIFITIAGSEHGFVPNSLFMLKSEPKLPGECHESMNYENYKNWLENQLIPNLPPNAVVVIGNAPYHNVEYEPTPSSNSKKSEMQAWLIEKGISFSPDMLKPELYEIIKKQKDQYKKYTIDKILYEHNHCVLRLPPYHRDLNPLEMAWAAIEGYVSGMNVEWDFQTVMGLVQEKVDQMGPEELKAIWETTQKIEYLYVQSDHIIDDLTDNEVIIEQEDSSDGDSDDSDSSDDDRAEFGTSGSSRVGIKKRPKIEGFS